LVDLSVYENVELLLICSRVKAAESTMRVEAILDNMEIMHRRNQFPHRLSGGQQQRVSIARAVAYSPTLIQDDGPTRNPDSANGNDVMQLLTDLNEQGTTVIMVTHSETDAMYSHRIIRLLDGKVLTENINTLVSA